LIVHKDRRTLDFMKPKAKILITGSSGLLGSAITARLDEQGISWKALHHGEPGWDPENGVFDPAHLEGIDGVIHLAGENIAAGRWTETQKQKIADSRINGTRALAEGIAGMEKTPAFLICASATGYYGDRGEEECSETSPPADGFLSEVVQGWESAADPARSAGVRVVHLRLGIVLSPEGGALKKMLPPFKFGLGGRLGDGRMWMSWVHLEDAARAFVESAMNEDMSGIHNLVSPHPVRNVEFTQTLASALHRPAVLPAPAFMIRLLLGEMGDALLLSSTRVRPQALQQAGFTFRYPTLEGALTDLL
jgi:uncharacterized protein (TIGR01777 family)